MTRRIILFSPAKSWDLHLVGGLLGSFAYNLLVTLGLAATIHAIPVDPHVTFIALPVMIVVHLALLVLTWYGKIPRVVGGLLVAAYVVYLITVVLCKFGNSTHGIPKFTRS